MTRTSPHILSQENLFAIHPLHDFKMRTTANQMQQKEKGLYDIIWVNEGIAELVAADKYNVQNNSVYCFRPGQLRQVSNQGGAAGFHIVVPADFLCIAGFAFNLSLLGGRRGADAQPIVIRISEDTKEDAASVLLKMTREFNQFLTLRMEIMRGLFNVFLLYISREYATKSFCTKVSRDAELVDNFFRLLQDSLRTKKKVQEYASELNLTPNYLNQVVKKITGFTASHHIQQQIILEAKKHALNAGCSMKEVAYGLGFDSMAHFSKFFKTNSGVNFTIFRKEAFCLRAS